jgi:hypothetical protein
LARQRGLDFGQRGDDRGVQDETRSAQRTGEHQNSDKREHFGTPLRPDPETRQRINDLPIHLVPCPVDDRYMFYGCSDRQAKNENKGGINLRRIGLPAESAHPNDVAVDD